MNHQYSMTCLPLVWTPLFDPTRYYVGESNRVAYQWISTWPWPFSSLCLYGPMGCGKTYLGSMWAKARNAQWISLTAFSLRTRGGCYIIDDADIKQGTEREMLAIMRELEECQAFCLWLARTPPSQWTTQLLDFSSRLKAITSIPIQEPDEEFLLQVLKQSLSEKGFKLSHRILSFLLKRLPRSFESVGLITSWLLQAPQPLSWSDLKSFIAMTEGVS